MGNENGVIESMLLAKNLPEMLELDPKDVGRFVEHIPYNRCPSNSAIAIGKQKLKATLSVKIVKVGGQNYLARRIESWPKYAILFKKVSEDEVKELKEEWGSSDE